MNIERKIFKKLQRVSKKIIKWGAECDKHNIPFKVFYQNNTSLKAEKEAANE